MGNAPSKESQGRPVHNKLSKPRVTSSATATAPKAALLASNGQPTDQARPHDVAPDLISVPYSTTASSVCTAQGDGAVDGDDGDDGDRIPHRDPARSTFLTPPKVQRRLSLFRSKSSQEASDRRKSRRNTIIGSPSLSLPSPPEDATVGRANSVSTHHLAEEPPSGLWTPQSRPTLRSRPTSWAYDLSSYEAQRILSLVQESPPPLPRSQTLTPRAEARPGEMQTPAWRRASIAVHPESAPISRSNSEISLHPPMRRRSLIQTPGVATRTRPGPVASKSARSSLRHSHPPTPNMSRQSSFEAREARFLSLAPIHASRLVVDEEVPRVQTPKEADYSTTGAFKFGTLRITNGSPSLTPNVAAVSGQEAEKSKSTGPSGDYFAQETCEPGVTRTTDQAPTQLAVQDSGPQFSKREPTASAQQSLCSVDLVAAPTLKASLLDTRSGGQFNSASAWPIPDGAPEKCPGSPLLKTQSRQAAVDDELFEDDDQAEISLVEVLDVRIDPSAKSPPPQASDSPQVIVRDFKRSDSGLTSESKSASPQACSSLAKADSGYSSNVSVRSLRGGRNSAKKDREAGRPSAESDGEMLEAQASLAVGGDGRALEGLRSDKAPTPPPKDEVLSKQASPPLLCGGVGPGSVQATSAGKIPGNPVRQQPSAIDTSHDEEKKSIKSPESVPPTPVSVKSDGSSSSLSIGNSTQKPGRLQRLLSLRNAAFSKQQYTVHVTHAVDSKIPSIPKEVEEKLREHTGLFPITTKRLALRSQMSKETLKTILSVGSLELTREDDLPRSPTFFDKASGDDGLETGATDARERSLKQALSSMQSNFKHAAASMIPHRKPIVRKPVPTRKESQMEAPEQANRDDRLLPVEAELTSHSSVNSYLGRSAYDAAAAAMDPRARTDRSMSLNMRHTGRDVPQPRRTYSLNSTPPRVVNDGLPRVAALSREGQRPEKRNSSPPVSMATRGSFRMPPPRSPLSPKGPASRPEQSRRNEIPSPSLASYTPSPGRLMEHRVSLDGVLQARPTAGHRQQMSTGSPSVRPNSLDSPRPSAATRRHNSTSSTQSDFVRDPRNFQSYRQHSQQNSSSGPALKHQPSPEGFGESQTLRVHHVPRAAHQGPATAPPHQLDFASRNWNAQSSSCPMDSAMHPSQAAWVPPPYVPRGHHRRNLSAGSRPHYDHASDNQAPYRILHSYNSPAYRNAPIWG